MLKKRKILNYFDGINVLTIFDELLQLYVSGNLYDILSSWGLKHISIYVELKEDYKNIDVQAKYHRYFYEWQFGEGECSYMIYIDEEPDEPTYLSYVLFKDANELLLHMQTLVPTNNIS